MEVGAQESEEMEMTEGDLKTERAGVMLRVLMVLVVSERLL